MAIRTVVKHNNFARIAAQLHEEPEAIINTCLIEMKDLIAQSAPVGSTGQLHTKIRIERAKHLAGGWRGRLFMVFYWRFVNYGTHGVPARPFVEPAAEAEGLVFTEKVRAIFRRT